MAYINTEEFRLQKQEELNRIAEEKNETPKVAKVELKDCLNIMTENELHTIMLIYLPLVNIDDNPTKERCKFLVGTLS